MKPMEIVGWAMLGVVVALTCFLLFLALWNHGPSCAERGGKKVLDHHQPVWSGKVLVLVPHYRCEGVR